MAEKPTVSVTLTTTPWDRRAIVRDTITETDVEVCGGEVEMIERRVDVWRREVPPLVRALESGQRLALKTFADTPEALGASRGTVDPSSAGGARPTPTGPSLARLTAAERTSGMGAAIAQVRVLVGRCCDGRKLARLLAVDDLPANEIARRLGSVRGRRDRQRT